MKPAWIFKQHYSAAPDFGDLNEWRFSLMKHIRKWEFGFLYSSIHHMAYDSPFLSL